MKTDGQKMSPKSGAGQPALNSLVTVAVLMSLGLTACANLNSSELPMPKEALEAAWQKEITEGEESNQQSMFKDSEESLTRALSFAQKFGEGDPRLERTLRALCLCYLGRAKFADAEAVEKRLLKIYDNAGPESEEKAADACLEIGRALVEQKRNAEARTFYDRALSIYQKVKGDGHANTAWIMHELAVLDEMDGKYSLAEPLFKKAALLHEAAAAKSGSNDGENERFQLAIAANQRLATCLIMQDKFDEVVPLINKLQAQNERCSKSVKGDQQASATQMEVELELSELMQQVAHHLISTGSKDTTTAEAEGFLKAALAMKRKYYSVDDLALSATINELAELYLNRKDYKAAEPLLAEAYDIRERICDKNSWELAELAEENARLMQAKKDAKHQKEFETVAFKVWPKETFVNKSPWRDHFLKGTKSQQMEQWEEAATEFSKSVEDARKYGANDARLAESLLRASFVYSQLQQEQKALASSKEAFEIRKKIPGFAKIDAELNAAEEKAKAEVQKAQAEVLESPGAK